MGIERVFAIGDIHGCLDKLVPLINMIKCNPDQDLLLFIGDYIDRGSHSREVVDYLVDLKQRLPETIFLLGNHEQMFLEYIDGRDTDAFLYNGGEKTLRSYLGSQPPGSLAGQQPWLPAAHQDFYRALRPYYEWEDYIFVHAGLRNGVPLAQQDLFDLIWIREEFFYSDYDFGKNIVFGHTPFPQPFIHNHRIGIDTGAVYGNRLTCLELPAVKFYAV